MDRKGSRGSHSRADRRKKRRFSSNRFTVERETSYTSASAAKFKNSGDEEVIINKNFGYCILEFYSVFQTLSTLIVCATCKEEIKFSQTAPRGLGFKIALQCNCESITYIQSCPTVNKAYEINRRIVTAMRLLGVGREGINIFCSVMDICQGLCVSTYNSCLDNLHSAASAVYDQLISKAVKEEQELLSESEPNQNPKNLTVSGVSTWKQRGFASLFGIATLIGKYSKKVVDTVVKSSFCQDCNLWKGKNKFDVKAYEDWFKEHVDSCAINCKESSGKMEKDAVLEMFNRSVEKHEVKYSKFIGDGEGVPDMNPYDDDPVVEKQCLGSETQINNDNESLFSLIWTFAPKHITPGPQTIQIASYLAVAIFNGGFLPILKIMELMGITVGTEAHTFAVRRNEVRVDHSELKAGSKKTAEIAYEVEEGPMYGSGRAD
ncbi:GSCOCG00002783001-RA-CDS [Cotesia congregata]|nr:GSCOCG00002783001-RA-CDS [Cotesia congregata]